MKPRGYQVGFYNLTEGVRDREGRLRKAEKIAYLLKMCNVSSWVPTVCLDVGCASGFITATLAPLFVRIIGVEYDEGALRDVPRPIPASTLFVRGDAMRLPVADDAVDAVICAQVYEHVPDDEQLAAEIYRVLKPGGVVFFSGPNKLFPIEPHYFLPFLHWLPSRWADACLRLLGQGNQYYERSRTLWGLRRLFARFVIRDVTLELLRTHAEWVMPRWWARGSGSIPLWAWKILLPVLPNFNWILYKS